jgi:hypothetical protein
MGMVSWKLTIFMRAVQIRCERGEGTYEQILETYPKLTAEEKAEILAALTKGR